MSQFTNKNLAGSETPHEADNSHFAITKDSLVLTHVLDCVAITKKAQACLILFAALTDYK